jgi:hypothetical protein
MIKRNFSFSSTAPGLVQGLVQVSAPGLVQGLVQVSAPGLVQVSAPWLAHSSS